MESLLGCKDLSVRFYQREENVLTDIHLSISRGEKVLILGPSGSGKSTLLSALSGIIPEHVEAEVEGEIQLAPQCGVMFQDPDSQFCMLHVDEEIAFSLENRSIPRAQMDTMIDTVMSQDSVSKNLGSFDSRVHNFTFILFVITTIDRFTR